MALTRITGFHSDPHGDWIAELACGHTQHVRHRPPWQSRPWTQTAEGRSSRLGAEIECPLCGPDPPGSRRRAVLWQRIDTVGVEYAELEWDPVRLQGEVVLVEDGTPFALSYRVDCDAAGLTARAHVEVKRSGGRDELTLARDPAGDWSANGRALPELRGLADVDLSVTPSTNTPPIRRLRLEVGQSAEVTAAWVRLPSLDVAPLRQIYRRSAARTYAYEAPDLSFRANLEVDEHGVVREYGGLWRLVTGSGT